MTTFADIVAAALHRESEHRWCKDVVDCGLGSHGDELAAAILADPRLAELLAGALLPTMRADMSASEVAAAIIHNLGENEVSTELAALLPYLRHRTTCYLRLVRDNAPDDENCNCGLREEWQRQGVRVGDPPPPADGLRAWWDSLSDDERWDAYCIEKSDALALASQPAPSDFGEQVIRYGPRPKSLRHLDEPKLGREREEQR